MSANLRLNKDSGNRLEMSDIILYFAIMFTSLTTNHSISNQIEVLKQFDVDVPTLEMIGFVSGNLKACGASIRYCVHKQSWSSHRDEKHNLKLFEKMRSEQYEK